MSHEPSIFGPDPSPRPEGPARWLSWRASLARLSLLVGLFAVSARNFEFFHAVVELFCVGVAVAIVVYAWNARGIVIDTYGSVLGIGYGWVALLDLVHALAFPGMSVFKSLTTNDAVQLWLVSRFIQVIALLSAPLVVNRPPRFFVTWLAFGVLSVGLFSTVLVDLMPAAYDISVGTTAFKVGSEVVLIGLLAVAMGLTWRARRHLEAETVRLMSWSIVLTIVSELSLTFYRTPQGLGSVAGHLAKVVAYYLVYRAILFRGSLRPFQGLFRDVLESRARFRAVFDLLPRGAAVVTKDEAGRFVIREANPEAARSLALPLDDLVGKTCRELFAADHASVLEDALDKAWDSGTPTSREVVSHHEDGSLEAWLEHEVFRIPGDEIVIVTSDRTVEMRAVEDLRQTRDELRSLHTAQHRKLEDERRRIAQELHDELGQVATALTIGLDRVGRKASALDASLADPVNKLKGLAASTVDSIRRICAELRPSQLDLLGLPDALEAKLRDFERETGIETSFDVALDGPPLDMDLATVLYRIVQESLTNVARHSFAGSVSVSLRSDARTVTLEVEDDGRGITIAEAAAETSFGVLGMRERALSAGGRIEVTGEPDRGTSVRVVVPLSPVTGAP